jgi:hypothetical protein
MRIMKWIAGGSLCLALFAPGHEAAAQNREQRNLLARLFNVPRWQADVHAGIGNYGRFLLQQPVLLLDVDDLDEFNGFTGFEPERELRGSGVFTIGAGLGGMFLPRTGFRLGVSRAWSNLDWRDDTGDGSDILDADDVGDLAQTILSAEIMRFLLVETARISPFGSAGLLATWWNLNDAPDFMGDDNHFRWGATASLGIQFLLSRNFLLRLDANTSSIGNPFTGRNSYAAHIGHTIDEPGRVRKTDFRLALGYTWGRPHPTETTNGGKGSK